MISHEAVDHNLETEHGDSRNRPDGHEVLGTMHSVGEAGCGGPEQSSEKRNQKRTGQSDSVAFQVVSTAFRRDGGRVAIPVNSPKQKNDDAEDGTEVLQDPEPGTRTKERKRNLTVEEGDLMAEQMSGVGERVPEDVGGNAHENGQHDQGKAGKRVDGQGSWSELESCARACGQAGGERFLGIAVKEPEHDQAERQVERKDAQQAVAEAAMMCKRNEVFEIGCKAADDKGRHDETCAPERHRGGGMRQSKRHYENYDGFGAAGHIG